MAKWTKSESLSNLKFRQFEIEKGMFGWMPLCHCHKCGEGFREPKDHMIQKAHWGWDGGGDAEYSDPYCPECFDADHWDEVTTHSSFKSIRRTKTSTHFHWRAA